MTHPLYHAEHSARKFGGKAADFLLIHEWFDATKEHFADFRHRALRHHSQGIFEAQTVFGTYIVNSDGKKVPVRLIAEDHLASDMGGRIPSVKDWLSCIRPEVWMSRGYKLPVDS